MLVEGQVSQQSNSRMSTKKPERHAHTYTKTYTNQFMMDSKKMTNTPMTFVDHPFVSLDFCHCCHCRCVNVRSRVGVRVSVRVRVSISLILCCHLRLLQQQPPPSMISAAVAVHRQQYHWGADGGVDA